MNFKFSTWILILLVSTLGVHLTSSANSYDPSASVFLFQKQMAKRGNAESQYKLGLMYETGSGAKSSIASATRWYKKAALQHYKPASNRLTYLDIKKSGFTTAHEEWLKNLKTEARFNDGEALFLLGQMYAEGTGVNKNLTRSLKYLKKAAGGNIPGSETEINHVEAELALLKKQNLKKKQKKTTVPLVILSAHRALKTSPKPAIPSKTISTKSTSSKAKQIKTKARPVKKVATRKRTNTKNIHKKTVASTSKKTNISNVTTNTKKAPLVKPTTMKVLPIVDSHPMDTICGGRNRYGRGCR